MTKVALVGGAHVHTPGFVKRLQARSEIEVKYVWDHDAGRAEKWAAELEAQTAAELDQIWSDAEISGAIICSETNRHKPLVLAGAEAGKHLSDQDKQRIDKEMDETFNKAASETRRLVETRIAQGGQAVDKERNVAETRLPQAVERLVDELERSVVRD